MRVRPWVGGFAFLTLFTCLAAGMVLPCGLPILFGSLFGSTGGVPGKVILGVLLYLASFIVIIFAILAIWSLVTHLVLKLLNGDNEPIRRTAQAICFSSGAGVFLAIPCFGIYGIGWLWWIVSAILMVKEGQRTGGGKATAAVLAGPVVAVVILVSGYSLLMYRMVTRVASFPTTMPAAVYAETTSMSKALRSYAAIHGGRGPAHAVELATRNYLPYSNYCLANEQTQLSDVPVGDTTLEKLSQLTPGEVAAAVSKAVAALPPGTVAYRFGDFVFTYPGINLNAANPKLWMFVEIPAGRRCEPV